MLVLATYLWGGCVSCEQFFMLPGSADDCCQDGKCKETSEENSLPDPPQRDCATMPLVHQQLQDSGSVIAALILSVPVHTLPAADLFTLHDGPWRPRRYFDPVAESRPDLVILTASFLI
ncbi:MAG: hypothetical protein ACRD96_04465 [Bryobacteraceae bacterium]